MRKIILTAVLGFISVFTLKARDVQFVTNGLSVEIQKVFYQDFPGNF